MSNELATTNQSTDVQLQADMSPVTPSTLESLKSYAEAWSSAAQIAEQVARTDFAGPFKNKPQDMAVAILKGASLGIPPENIGKSIYVVHGTPALYGKTALAIALQNGYIAETTEDTPQAVTVRMTSPKGQEMEVRYTIERATKEGLVKGNKVQYETRPSKMLYWKCIGELTDRMIPHLTGGMPVKEDVEQSEPIKAEAKRLDVHKQRGKEGLRAALEAKKHATDTPPAEQPEEDWATKINTAESKDQLSDLMAELQALDMPDDEYDPLAKLANTKWEELN